MKYSCTMPVAIILVHMFLLLACERPAADPGQPPAEPRDTTDVEIPDTTQSDTLAPVISSLKYADFLDEMVSYDAMTRYPDIHFESRQESSHDRRSKDPASPDWFANDDGWGYERIEYLTGREEKVIFDEKHPGVITRIWLTSFGSPETILRFYFDGATEPSWQIDSYNLKEFAAFVQASLGDALAQPSTKWIRGSSLYLPITYSRSCKITIQELVEPLSVSRYYHINYRRYDDDFGIETLTPTVFKRNLAKIKSVNSLLSDPLVPSSEVISANGEIDAGESIRLSLPQGTRSVNELRVKVCSEGEALAGSAIDSVTVKGFFDGKQTFNLPLTELAGTGTGGYYNNSWRFKSNGRGEFTIRWVMPYRENASMVFENSGNGVVSIEAEAEVGDYLWDSRSLYFHAFHHRTNNEPVRYWSDYANGVEWKFGEILGGRGVYSGDVYTIDNHTSEWPGEGDEKIWVDDEEYPSHFGTGVEDYYSFCGYFRFHTPFSGEPRLDRNNFNGVNIHYRTRNLDIIPFDRHLLFNLEMQGHEAGTANVSSTIFWYGDSNTEAK